MTVVNNHIHLADRSKGSDAIAAAAVAASKRSEDNSRKMILESYERAGVDLPLVELETVLDREISEDDPRRQNGAPRFRKFLNKASSAMANRGTNNNNDSYNDGEKGPDDEIVSDADVFSDLNSSSYTSNSNAGDYETLQLDNKNANTTRNVPNTPDRPVTSSGEDPEMMIPPATPESMKNDLCNPAAFDFCCPNKHDSPAKIMVSDSKYVMSNLQLAEGFDDEHDGNINNNSHLQESALDVRALTFTDMEESGVNDANSSVYSMEKQSNAKGFGGGSGSFGMLSSYFQGSRRFRFSILVCCLLHVVLIGLIIAFVASAGNNDASVQVDSSSSAISQGQTAATIPSVSTNTSTAIKPGVVIPEPDLGTQLDPVVEESTDSTSDAIANNNSTNTDSTQDIIAAEDNVIQENTTAVVVPEDEQQSSPDSTCVNSLEVSTECAGEDTELYVYFESCTPQPGDWVAIYEFSESLDPQNLPGTGWIGWLYTCGDRVCTETVEKEVLSFTRAKDRVAEETALGSTAGTTYYQAHLMREGEGPVFSSIASSPEFRIVSNADGGC